MRHFVHMVYRLDAKNWHRSHPNELCEKESAGKKSARVSINIERVPLRDKLRQQGVSDEIHPGLDLCGMHSCG